jgi:hypothetical protein
MNTREEIIKFNPILDQYHRQSSKFNPKASHLFLAFETVEEENLKFTLQLTFPSSEKRFKKEIERELGKEVPQKRTKFEIFQDIYKE